jgi:transcriptional regulator with XRE-family HTH domain
MNTRIKQLRKQLKMTQTEFGEALGVKGNTVTGYESGIRTPSDAVIMSICREFNVNEGWLRTGEGEMLKPQDLNKGLEEYFATLSFGGDSFQKRLISVLSRLDENDWKTLEKLARELAEK